MKIKAEAVVEFIVEVPEGAETDVIIEAVRARLRNTFKDKKRGNRKHVPDVAEKFQITIIGKA